MELIHVEQQIIWKVDAQAFVKVVCLDSQPVDVEDGWIYHTGSTTERLWKAKSLTLMSLHADVTRSQDVLEVHITLRLFGALRSLSRDAEA